MFFNIKLKRFFAYVKHFRCCVLLLTQSPSSPAIRKKRLLTYSLWRLWCAASCPRTLLLSKRYCYGGLIILGHKSSFDQLIFTYWKRPTQLSKQLFHCVAISFFFYGFFLFHCLCLCHPTPPPPSLSLSLSLHIFRLISPFLYIFVTFMSASMYMYYSFSLTVCSYFFVFFRVRPLSLYVSLSLCPSV